MLSLKFNELTTWQQQLFAAAVLHRMLPNYQYFSEAVGFGEYQVLRNQMDIIWQKLSQLPIKFNLEAQLEKLQKNIPDPDTCDVFAVYPAINACAGLITLLESFDEKQTDCASELSQLSLDSVEGYLELVTQNDPETKSKPISIDPLYRWEHEMQTAIFNAVTNAKQSKEDVKEIRYLVSEEKVSNLGIEYD